MAFGPAVLPGVQVGRRVSMILVAKDSTGKARTSDDDLTLARTLTPTLTLTRTPTLTLPLTPTLTLTLTPTLTLPLTRHARAATTPSAWRSPRLRGRPTTSSPLCWTT